MQVEFERIPKKSVPSNSPIVHQDKSMKIPRSYSKVPWDRSHYSPSVGRFCSKTGVLFDTPYLLDTEPSQYRLPRGCKTHIPSCRLNIG